MLIYFSFLCLIKNFLKFFLLNCFRTIAFLLLKRERERDRQTDRETDRQRKRDRGLSFFTSGL